MRNRIKKIILGSSIISTALFVSILVSCLMLLDFFGANIIDNYVENNADYSSKYLSVVNKNIREKSGYVSLSRILYFYLEDDSLTFDEIYSDNLNLESKQVLPISDVCIKNKYKYMEVCSADSIKDSTQVNEIQNKPFSMPLDFSKSSITSYFKQERIIYSKNDIHNAWDFAAQNKTPVLSICDGKVNQVSFNYLENKIDKSGGLGNFIKIECDSLDEVKYYVTYAHLYPSSAKIKAGDIIQQGKQLAEVGTTGYSTGPHLHFQVQNNDGLLVDGMSLIDFNN